MQQFPLILGLQQIDWMSEQPSPLDPPAPPFSSAYPMQLPLLTGFESMLTMAGRGDCGGRDRDASSAGRASFARGSPSSIGPDTDLPTGVGFRRMFLEVLVLDAQGEVLWASGRTNELGFILDGITDEVLESGNRRASAAPVQRPTIRRSTRAIRSRSTRS